MHYLIDGYNLLFRIMKVGGSLHDQRKEVTIGLERKLAAIDLNATLIFDSHYREDEGSRGHLNALEIIFTAHGESADAYILHHLKESPSPQNYTVVTSDKHLARLCRLRLASTETIDEFMGLINKRYKNKLKQAEFPKITNTPAPPPPPPPPKEPAPNAPAENCFDYYLRLFEEAAEAAGPPPPTHPVKEKPQKLLEENPKKKKNRTEKLQEPPLSNEERWLKAFETPRNDEQNLL